MSRATVRSTPCAAIELRTWPFSSFGKTVAVICHSFSLERPQGEPRVRLRRRCAEILHFVQDDDIRGVSGRYRRNQTVVWTPGKAYRAVRECDAFRPAR